MNNENVKSIWFENVVIPKITSYDSDIDEDTGQYLIIVNLDGNQSVMWRFLSFEDAYECEENLKVAVEEYYNAF